MFQTTTLPKRPLIRNAMTTTPARIMMIVAVTTWCIPSSSSSAFVAVVHLQSPSRFLNQPPLLSASSLLSSSSPSSSFSFSSRRRSVVSMQGSTHNNNNLDEEETGETDNDHHHDEITIQKNTRKKETNRIQHMATSLVAALTIALSTTSLVPLPADAAMSGGRMGGSFSSSRSSPSSSFRGASSGGRRSMYSGGGGGGGYYYGGGPRTTIVAPIISPFVTTPFYNPMVPYYGGGVGAISYARGPGLFDLLFLGGIGFFVLSAISNTISGTQASSSFGQWDDSRSSIGGSNMFASTSSPTTVFKCNVALDVSNRDDPNSILSVLDRMAKVTAKTDTRKGVLTLTKQVALELLRRKSAIYSAAGTIQQYNNDKEAQRTYNQWSIQERSKFEQENINKFNKFDLSLVKSKDALQLSSSSSSSKATMAVVTLVLSFDASMLSGNYNNIKKMKQIQSLPDLESILQAIASMSTTGVADQDDALLYGAEILWTPEDRSETLTRKDILADYPELNVL